MGARISEFFICASSFLEVSSSAWRLRSASMRSFSTTPRNRFTSDSAFSYSTAATLPDATTSSSRCKLSSATLSGSSEGNGSFARSVAASRSARACLSWRAVLSSAMVASNWPFVTLFPIAPRPSENASANWMNPEFCARTWTTNAGSMRTVP